MSYKVVVLIKPKDEQPALDRAAEFARFMPDLEVVAVRVVNEFTEDKKQALEQTYTRELINLKDRYPSIEHFTPKVLFAQDVAEGFCDFAGCASHQFDLVIISANKRNTLKDLFFSTIDSQIMRKVPVPLLVVKDAQAPQRLSRAIVLAIDFEEDNHDKFVDEVLFESAKIFAENFNGEVHVLNCVPPRHTSLMGGNLSQSVILGNKKPLSRTDIHAQALCAFAERHGIPQENCHIAEGRVDEMIPKVCEGLEARMVCMGTSNNDGVLSAIDQGASELVLEQVKGDLFIVNRLVKLENLRPKS